MPLIPTLDRSAIRRPALLGLAAAAVVGALAVPALAVGTSGVDLTPRLPRSEGGSYILTVEDREVGSEAQLLLTNLTDEPREARVYAASATMRGAGEGVAVGGAGSVPWLALDERFDLAPEEQVEVPVVVDARRADLPEDGDHFVALVLEVSPSASLVTQAVTIVRVQQGAATPLPSWPLILAIVLLVVAAAALARFGRRPVAASDASGTPET